jgi:hypothetical protein
MMWLGSAFAGEQPPQLEAEEMVFYLVDYAVCEILTPETPVDVSVRGTYTINGGELKVMPHFIHAFLTREDAKLAGFPPPDGTDDPQGVPEKIHVNDGQTVFQGINLSDSAKRHIVMLCRSLADLSASAMPREAD